MFNIVLFTFVSLVYIPHTFCGEEKSEGNTSFANKQRWSRPGCQQVNAILKSIAYINEGEARIQQILLKEPLDLAECKEVETGDTLLHKMAEGDGHYEAYFSSWPFLIKTVSRTVNTKNNPQPKQYSSTPLHYAAYRGDADAVQLLLRHNADPLIKNDLGLTPARGALSAFTDCYINQTNLESYEYHGIHGRTQYGKALDLLVAAEAKHRKTIQNAKQN